MDATRQTSPPLPVSLRLAFLLGPALVCASAASIQDGTSTATVLREGSLGLATGLLLTGGLALSARFFAGPGARVAGGLAFAALLAVSVGALGYTGCGWDPARHEREAQAAQLSRMDPSQVFVRDARGHVSPLLPTPRPPMPTPLSF